MRIIGITGGVGSGKSRVLSFLKERYGAVICQADHVAWDLQKPGTATYQEILENFGSEILNEDGTICRQKLGQIVFGDGGQLEILNRIMHPAVKREIESIIAENRANKTELFVLEAALLLEEGYDLICDSVWYVYAEEQVRKLRLKENRGYSEEKSQSIMDCQVPDVYFREHSHFVIDNSGEFSDTMYQIEQFIKL